MKKAIKTLKSSNNHRLWFYIGLIGVLLCIPNATVIKYTTGSVDPFYYNSIRFLIVSLIMTPFIIKHLPKLRGKKLKDSILAGIFMAIAATCYVLAIKLSQASYVSIILLIAPIFLVIYSVKMTGEKITTRAIAGITLAAIGAMTIVALPVAIQQQGDFVFYPWATVLALINCAFFPLAVVFYRRANEEGVPMSALMGLSSWTVFSVNAIIMVIVGVQVTSLSTISWLGILYGGLIVSLLSRVINVVSYEHIGSAVSSSLGYLEIFLAILFPVAVLHEKLSVEMVIGGILILAGVYIVEHHKSVNHKHHFIWRSH